MKGFRDFIMRGNVIDLAVAFVIGAAFGALVTSFVQNIFTPLLAALFAVPDLGTLVIDLPNGAQLQVGFFLNALISFLMIAAAIYFIVIVPMQRMRQPTEATTKTCPHCASEIPLAATRCPLCTSELAA